MADAEPVKEEKTLAKPVVKNTETKKPAEKKTVKKKPTATKPKTTTTAKKPAAKKTTPKKEEKPKSKPAVKKTAETKPAVKKPVETKKETPEKEEKTEGQPVEEKTKEEYIVKKKPELSKELKEQLQKRKQIKKRTPNFIREEWFRYKRIPHNWRRPDGITSKMRKNLKYRPSKVRIGFRGPRDTRGLHPSGFEEILVYNVNDIGKINPKTQAARIGGTVGTKKRIEIEKKAEELDIRILNM